MKKGLTLVARQKVWKLPKGGGGLGQHPQPSPWIRLWTWTPAAYSFPGSVNHRKDSQKEARAS